ncbi:MAG: hypothetical protein AAGC74_02985 [Verrucomicrobiota bacterium]
MKNILPFLFLTQLTFAGSPIGPKDAVPPESVFKGEIEYEIGNFNQKDRGLKKGVDLTIPDGQDVRTLEVFFKTPPIGIYTTNYYKDPQKASAAYDSHVEAMKERSGTETEELQEKDGFKYLIIKDVGSRFACSVLVQNVHFIINDTGARKDREWVLAQALVCARSIKVEGATVEAPKDEILPKNPIPVSIANKTQWTGANGNTLNGRIIAFDAASRTLNLALANGKIFNGVSLDKFSPEDRAEILAAFEE